MYLHFGISLFWYKEALLSIKTSRYACLLEQLLEMVLRQQRRCRFAFILDGAANVTGSSGEVVAELFTSHYAFFPPEDTHRQEPLTL